jgi:hypothetical protein
MPGRRQAQRKRRLRGARDRNRRQPLLDDDGDAAGEGCGEKDEVEKNLSHERGLLWGIRVITVITVTRITGLRGITGELRWHEHLNFWGLRRSPVPTGSAADRGTPQTSLIKLGAPKGMDAYFRNLNSLCSPHGMTCMT